METTAVRITIRESYFSYFLISLGVGLVCGSALLLFLVPTTDIIISTNDTQTKAVLIALSMGISGIVAVAASRFGLTFNAYVFKKTAKGALKAAPYNYTNIRFTSDNCFAADKDGMRIKAVLVELDEKSKFGTSRYVVASYE